MTTKLDLNGAISEYQRAKRDKEHMAKSRAESAARDIDSLFTDLAKWMQGVTWSHRVHPTGTGFFVGSVEIPGKHFIITCEDDTEVVFAPQMGERYVEFTIMGLDGNDELTAKRRPGSFYYHVYDVLGDSKGELNEEFLYSQLLLLVPKA